MYTLLHEDIKAYKIKLLATNCMGKYASKECMGCFMYDIALAVTQDFLIFYGII